MLLRTLCIFILILVGFINSLSAQSEKKQSLSMSYNLAPMSMLKKDPSPYMHNNNDLFFSGTKFEALMGDYGYKAVGYDSIIMALWN
jgi:hypothetical protein